MSSQNIRIQIQNRYENMETLTVWSTLLPANSGRHGSQLFFYLQRNELSWKTKSRERNYSRVISKWTKCMFPFKKSSLKMFDSKHLNQFVFPDWWLAMCHNVTSYPWRILKPSAPMAKLSQILFNSQKDIFIFFSHFTRFWWNEVPRNVKCQKANERSTWTNLD